jgi:hypothetical protein
MAFSRLKGGLVDTKSVRDTFGRESVVEGGKFWVAIFTYSFMKPIGELKGDCIMKRNKLFGRAINEWAIDLEMEDDAALFNYMIGYLKRLNMKYEIEKCYQKETWVYIRVDCDDEMMSILRNLYYDFEYDWSEEEGA